MDKIELWQKCVDFLGHVCGGLTIGYKAALYAMELLEVGFSEDEDIVCVAENDACGVDAIQVMLGCSIGKGNLLFKLRGKSAFNFYNRKTGKSIRLVFKESSEDNKKFGKDEIMAMAPSNLFDVKEVTVKLPERARIFNSFKCECCGEKTADYFTRNQNGKTVCIDCFNEYNRFSN